MDQGILRNKPGWNHFKLEEIDKLSVAAANTTANNLSSYVQMPAMALGAAVSSFAVQNIGAGHWERVRRTTWIGIRIILC